MPRIPATQRSPYETIGRRPKARRCQHRQDCVRRKRREQAARTTGRRRPSRRVHRPRIFAALQNVPQRRLFRSARWATQALEGRKPHNITRTEAARYQQALEAEAVELSEPAHLAKAKAENKSTERRIRKTALRISAVFYFNWRMTMPGRSIEQLHALLRQK